MTFSRADIHHGFYVLATGVLMASLPLSHFVMGLVTFLLLLNWVAEWNWREKWDRVRQNPQGLVFSALFVVMCLGLFKTDNWHNAGQYMLGNLSVLFAPIIIISSRPFSRREMNWFFHAFIVATTVGCACSVGYWLTHEVHDLRTISLFIDHIRFSLCVVLALVLSVRMMLQKLFTGATARVLYALNALLMVVYLFIAQTLTGILLFLILTVAFLFYVLLRSKNVREKWLMLAGLVLVLGLFSLYCTWITYIYYHDNDKTITATTTALGNDYTFEDDGLVECGHRVNYYVCRPELERAWAMRSDTTYDYMTEATLIRYLNSKGLHKDSAAVMALSSKDIHNIEQQIANVEYTRPLGLRRALYQTYFSFSNYKLNHSINGSSLLERVELWKASWNAISDNWLLGVGVGDQKAALDRQLELMDSAIAHRHNRGCHNQMLTYWLIGGVLLAAALLFVLVYPFFGMRKRVTFTYVALFIIVFCSMLVEDTIDTQTGRMLFSIVMPMMLFNEERNEAVIG